MKKAKKTKVVKKTKKLSSIPKINRKLFKLWSIAVRTIAGNQCAYCGIKSGDMNQNNKPTKIDAHHLISRNIHDCPLKFDIMNGIALCPFCHKFGIPSFHRDPITTITWLQQNQPEKYKYVLENSSIRIDLANRDVLTQIETFLSNNEPLDIPLLLKIQEENPRKVKVKKEKIDMSEFENTDEDTDEELDEELEDL